MKGPVRNAIHVFWLCPLIGCWLGAKQGDSLGLAVVWLIFVAPIAFALVLFGSWLYSE